MDRKSDRHKAPKSFKCRYDKTKRRIAKDEKHNQVMAKVPRIDKYFPTVSSDSSRANPNSSQNSNADPPDLSERLSSVSIEPSSSSSSSVLANLETRDVLENQFKFPTDSETHQEEFNQLYPADNLNCQELIEIYSDVRSMA
ncbi:hypothetical protein TKK_0000224 [Trichogramma kaykai]